ncbi:hypothetical protein [Actinomadura chibensis]|uniref:Uncharacterized protein n=1 Tax=Actinomadura chibensis TaxID=392828 RepID=A0A5D0NYQ5_9ACTN|nr:hypothetical protein [Actinomadura chibensis]TYB49595.1 hypothetical protein FXF69_11120 [Actinomadura chibensis]
MTQDFDLGRPVAVDPSGAWHEIPSHPVLRGVDATIARPPERVPRHRIPQMAPDWALAHAGVHRERAA